MGTYKLFLFQDFRLHSASEFLAADDAAALRHAEQSRAGREAELWIQGRRVRQWRTNDGTA